MQDNFLLTPIAQAIWEDRYALKDSSGNPVEKSIFENFRRVAKAIASKEKNLQQWEDAFFSLMHSRLFSPAGRVLAHAGTHFSQLGNCFVVPFKDDSLEEIMNTAKSMAIIEKHGGGCGFNFSRLRPSGSYIKGVNGRSCGTIGFISMLSTVSEVIEQGGCFVGSTLIATAEGPKAIKDLQQGDLLYSLSQIGYVTRFCSNPWVTKKQAEVWKLTTSKGLEIYATPDHPFMPVGYDFSKKNYIKLRDLESGLSLVAFNKNRSLSDLDSVISAVFSHYEDVYNVEVEDTHNYVVCNSDMTTGAVVSNSRRGANLGLLEAWHPDVWEFISYKTEHDWDHLRNSGVFDVRSNEEWEAFKYENLYKWQMFNVSVGVTDEFMEAVRKNREWVLHWKETEWSLYEVSFTRGKQDPVIFKITGDSQETALWKVRRRVPYPRPTDVFKINNVRRLKATEIWDRICYNAWSDGCPGLLNVSTIRKMHNLEYCSPFESTNPCLAGETMVAVADGRNSVSIRQLAEEGMDVPVYCRKPDGGFTIRMMRNPRITGYNQRMFKVTVEGGCSVRVTENHKFTCSDGLEIKACDLKPGVSLSILNRVNSQEYSWLNVTDKKTWFLEKCAKKEGISKKVVIEAEVPGADLQFHKFLELKDTSDLNLFFEDGVIKVRKNCEGCGKEIIVGWSKREISYCSNNCHADHYRMSEKGRQSIIKRRNELRDAKRVSLVLAYGDLKSSLGHPPMKKEFAALCRERKIPFSVPRDAFNGWKDLVQEAENFNHRVISVEYDGLDTVYNGTVDQYHNFYFGGFVEDFDGHVKQVYLNGPQCGEQPLPADGFCNLSSEVLPSFVNDGSFDFDQFKKAVHTAVRFSDNVIDNCEFPLPEIKQRALNERRVGLGTMGVHDMLIAMKLGYDTQEGRDFVEKVLTVLRDEAYRASIELAKEKGPFPSFDREKIMKSGFIQTLPQDIQDDIAKYGLRNATLISFAPTGTIGTMYSLSTGCEPHFYLSFTRNSRLGSYEDGCLPYIQWKKDHSGEPIPDYFKTSEQISPEDHIKMLVLFTKYSDSGVSKTVNMPNSSTVEDVKKAFMYAMEKGAKGVTIFREGSKGAVIVSSEKKAEEKKEPVVQGSDDSRMAPKKRTDRIEGATTRVHMQNHNLYVTVNHNENDEVIELFATVGESKNPHTRQTSGVEDSWAEALAKTISLSVRAGVRPEAIIRNLKNIPSDKPVFATIGDSEASENIPSPPHAVARVLEEELKKLHSKNKIGIQITQKKGGNCKNCGSDNITWRTPTCYDCKDCGTNGCE